MSAALQERYFLDLAAAFVRGKLGLADNNLQDLDELFQRGLEANLKLHKFKRTMELARVQRVFGILKGLQPETLLDIGSGRGAFLWPLLSEFPDLSVTAVDMRPDRIADIEAVSIGGIGRLRGVAMDACNLSEFVDEEFDIVTLLEVLEHMPDPRKAIEEAVRVSRRGIILSVPSKPDDNPEHIHLLGKERLQEMIECAGLRARFESVLNHIIAIAVKK